MEGDKIDLMKHIGEFFETTEETKIPGKQYQFFKCSILTKKKKEERKKEKSLLGQLKQTSSSKNCIISEQNTEASLMKRQCM